MTSTVVLVDSAHDSADKSAATEPLSKPNQANNSAPTESANNGGRATRADGATERGTATAVRIRNRTRHGLINQNGSNTNFRSIELTNELSKV